MKFKGIFLFAALLASAHGAIVTPTVKMETADGALNLTNLLPQGDWQNADLTLTLFDGKAKRNLPISGRTSEKNGRITVAAAGNKWSWTTTFQRRGQLICGESSFANLRDEEMWIEPGLRAAIYFAHPPVSFWDGFGLVRKIGKKPLERCGVKGLILAHVGSKELPFPAAGVFGPHGGLQLGHVIFDPVSYSAAYYHPGRQELRFTQRWAVHPGETLKFRWIIGSVDARFGGPEAAVQQHYDSMPERWMVSGGQDNPYLWENHANYLSWKYAPDAEVARRLKHSGDWAYCPYKRAGDIVGKEDLWDYKPHNPYVKKPWLRFGGVTIPIDKIGRGELQKIRRARYREFGRRYGWFYYSNCAGTWCEINLAKQLYPDAINNQDPHANHILKGWSTSHDWEIRVFPMGTSFAKAFEKDMKDLADELDLPGFALDCSSGGVSYYGPAVGKHLPGRAWDEKGVFIDQSVAVNHVVDYINSLRPGMTVFSNGPLKGDLIMFERSFCRTAEVATMMPLYKWYIGPRPSVNHGHGYMFPDMVSNWRKLSGAEFRETLGKLSIYHMFNQFKYGLTGTVVTQYGVPEMVYIFPELFELRRAGWRSLVPVRLSSDLYAPYRAAYGKDENSFLFFGNSRATASRGTVTVENELFHSDGRRDALIFVRKMRNQAQLRNRIQGGATSFDAVFPPRVPVLYETICSIGNAPDGMVVEAHSAKTLAREVYTAVLKETPPFNGTVKIRKIRNFDATLKLNGETVRSGSPLELQSGDKLTAEYTSQVYRIQQSDVEKFPFTDAKKEIVCKVWFDAADQHARFAANRIDEFFKFLQKRNLISRQSTLSIVHDPALRHAAGVISLDSRGRESQIALTPAGGLLITAPDASGLERNVDLLLDCMDKRYPYIFPFTVTAGMPGEVLKYFNMRGKHLPLRKFFE